VAFRTPQKAMPNHDSRDLESPARADASLLTTHRKTADARGSSSPPSSATVSRPSPAANATASAVTPRGSPGPSSAGIRGSAAPGSSRTCARSSGDLLAERDGPDERVAAYGLTGAGHALLIQRAERLAVLCDLRATVIGTGDMGSRRDDFTRAAPRDRYRDRAIARVTSGLLQSGP